LRVIAGTARSVPLKFPRGARIRPTTDAMREALFSSLCDCTAEARFADLYAGSGSVGIEALSRGAASCLFVEADRRCVATLRENLGTTGLADRAAVALGKAERVWAALVQEHGPFDVVFADPPYDLPGFAPFARRLVVDREGVAQHGIVVVQYGARHRLVGLPEPSRLKRFGDTEVRFYTDNAP